MSVQDQAERFATWVAIEQRRAAIHGSVVDVWKRWKGNRTVTQQIEIGLVIEIALMQLGELDAEFAKLRIQDAG